MKFIWNYFMWIWPPNFIWTSYELHENLPDNSCIFPTKFMRSSYEVLVKFIWIESFGYICISSEVHVNFIWNSYAIMCEISKWPWFSYVFHSKFIWHTDQNFQMKFHTNDTNRPSYIEHGQHRAWEILLQYIEVCLPAWIQAQSHALKPIIRQCRVWKIWTNVLEVSTQKT